MNKLFSNSLLGNSINIFAIRFVTVLANLFGIIYYSRNIAKEQYGAYSFLLITMAIFIALGNIGMSAVVFNFSDSGIRQFFKNLTLQKKIYYGLYLAVIASGFVTVLHFNDFPIRDASTYLLLFLFLIVAVLCFVLDHVLLLFQIHKQQLVLNILFTGIVIFAHVYALGSNQNLDMHILIQWWAIALVLKLAIQLLLFRQQLQAPSNAFLEMTEIQPSRKTWLQLGFYEVFQSIVKQSDKFIVGLFTTKEATALYFNGRIDLPFLPAILSSVRNAALIQLSKKTKDESAILVIIKDTFLILSSIAFGIVAFGMAYSEELFTVVFSEKYLQASELFVWSLWILPAQYCVSLSYILQYKEKANIINRGAFLDLIISILLLYPFYKWWGLSGIVISVVVSTYIQSFYYLLHTSNALKIQMWQLIPWKSYGLKIIISFGLAFLSHYLFTLIFDSTFTFIFGGITGLMCLFILFRIDKKASMPVL